MTIQEDVAAALEETASELIQAALALPEDKREWQPLGKGRSALSQLAECAAVNMRAAKVVQAGAYQEDWAEEWNQVLPTLDTLEKAIAQLRAGTAALVSAVREVPDSDLEHKITTPFITVTLAQYFLIPLWNMSYHEGQINYIGTLL